MWQDVSSHPILELTKKEAARAKVLFVVTLSVASQSDLIICSTATLKLLPQSNVPARNSQGAPVDYQGRIVKKLARKLEAGVALGSVRRKTASFAKGTSRDVWAEPERTLLALRFA